MGVRTSVLQVKICERTNPSRDVESDILIEAFEPIASQRFILITSIDEVAAAAGCQVEELQNNDKSDNVLWQHSIQGLNFVYDGESDQVALQLKAKSREDNAPTKSSILDLAINMIVEARGKGGQWAENKWSTARIVRCNVDGSSENQTFNIKFLSSGEEAIVTTANIRLPEEKIIEYVTKNTPGSKNDGKGNEEEMPSGEDAEAAAAKVQAYMRGKVAREQVAGMKSVGSGDVSSGTLGKSGSSPRFAPSSSLKYLGERVIVNFKYEMPTKLLQIETFTPASEARRDFSYDHSDLIAMLNDESDKELIDALQSDGSGVLQAAERDRLVKKLLEIIPLKLEELSGDTGD